MGRCRNENSCAPETRHKETSGRRTNQQSRFSWHVHPAEHNGHGGRTTPVFPPRQKRSVKYALFSSKIKYTLSVHIFSSKSVLIKRLCTLGIKCAQKRLESAPKMGSRGDFLKQLPLGVHKCFLCTLRHTHWLYSRAHAKPPLAFLQ
jgi:hypothetical protein